MPVPRMNLSQTIVPAFAADRHRKLGILFGKLIGTRSDDRPRRQHVIQRRHAERAPNAVENGEILRMSVGCSQQPKCQLSEHEVCSVGIPGFAALENLQNFFDCRTAVVGASRTIRHRTVFIARMIWPRMVRSSRMSSGVMGSGSGTSRPTKMQAIGELSEWIGSMMKFKVCGQAFAK